MILYYTKWGLAVPDAFARRVLLWAYRLKLPILPVSTTVLFNMARLLHTQGHIHIKYVKYDCFKIEIDEFAILSDWPNGLDDLSTDIHRQIIMHRLEDRKARAAKRKAATITETNYNG